MGIDGDIILKAGLDTTGVTSKIEDLKKSISKSLKNLIRIGFGVRSVFALIRKLRTALISGFGNLASVYEPFNKAMSEIKTSLNLLKNTFASAFAPIIETVAPILSQFINMVAEAVSQVGQFIAVLTGKEYVRAGTVWVDYAESLNGSTKSTNAQTAATKKQTEAQKKLNREITHFDDLVILHDKDKDNTTSGAATPDYSFTPTPVGDAIKQFAENFKAAWKEGDFTDIGRQIGDALKNALENIDWKGIQEKCNTIASSIATFLNGFLETPGLFTTIGNTIGEAINTALGALNTFAWKFHWGSLGNAISDEIIAVCSTINWDLVYSTVRGFANGFADYLNHLFTPETFSAIGTTVGNLISAALLFLNTFGERFDGVKFGASLATGINKALEKIRPLQLIKGIITVITTIRDTLVGFMGTINWYDIGIKLRDILKNLPWKLLLLSFGIVIWEAINAVISFFSGLFKAENVSGPVTDALESLQDTINDIAEHVDFKTLSEGFDRIVKALQPAAAGFAVGFINVFKELAKLGVLFFDLLSIALAAIGRVLEQMDPVFIESLGQSFGTFVGAFVAFWAVRKIGGFISNIASSMGELLGTIAAHPVLSIAAGILALAVGLDNLAKNGVFSDADSKLAIANCRAVIDETKEVRRNVSAMLDTIEGKDRDIEATYGTLRDLAGEYFNLKSKVHLTKEEQEKLRQLESTLSTELPDFQSIIGDTTGKYTDQKTAVFELIGQTEQYYKTLAAKEFLQDYYQQMFNLEVAIRKNENAHKDLIDAYDEDIDRSNLFGAVVGSIGDFFDGTKRAIQDNEQEYIKLKNQQADLHKQYEAEIDVLEDYGLSLEDVGLSAETMATNMDKSSSGVDDLSTKADSAQTNTDNLANAFGLFEGLSLATPIKMALISGAIKALGDNGKISDEQVSNLYDALADYKASPTETELGKVEKAFENTGISADNFLQAVTTSMQSLDDATIKEVGKAIKAIKDSGPDIKNESKETMKNVGIGGKEGIEETADDVIEAVGTMTDDALTEAETEAETGSPSKRTERLGKAIDDGLENGLKYKQVTLVDLAGTILSAVLKKMESFKTSFETTGQDLMSSLQDGVDSYSKTLPTTAFNIVDAMKTKANSLSFWNVGKNIAVGIYNGLFAHSSWLQTLAWNTAVNMYNSACDALDIASPSKKFAWIGEMMVTGLGKGVKDNEDVATDAVSNLTDAITDEAEGASADIKLDTAIGSWIDKLDSVLVAFSDKIVNSFDNLVNNLSAISTMSVPMPAVAQGMVIPSSLQAANSNNDNMTRLQEMLDSLTTNQMTVEDLRPLLVEMFTDYMNLGWYIGDEQLARHVKNGNLLLDRRYSIMK